MKDQWKSYKELKIEQERQLQHIINYSYNYVPYYRRLFDSLNLKPADIKLIEDLEKLPILTKKDINNNWDDFKPSILNKINYYNRATGGSTGTPFNYRIIKFERFLDGASIYKGWSFGFYEIGDRLILLGGSLIGIRNIDTLSANLEKKFHEYARNIKIFSSFDMDDKAMEKYVKIINLFKPYYIYGYVSSIYFLSKWIEKHKINVYQIKGIFAMAEKLQPHMRTKIENTFGWNVFDNYRYFTNLYENTMIHSKQIQ